MCNERFSPARRKQLRPRCWPTRLPLQIVHASFGPTLLSTLRFDFSTNWYLIAQQIVNRQYMSISWQVLFRYLTTSSSKLFHSNLHCNYVNVITIKYFCPSSDSFAPSFLYIYIYIYKCKKRIHCLFIIDNFHFISKAREQSSNRSRRSHMII